MTNRLAFNKGVVAALPCPDRGRATYYDDKVQKLALRVTAAGTRTFYVVKRADDGMAWVKLGTFPDMTVEQARKEAERKLGEFASGLNPAKARREAKQRITLGEAFERYMRLHVVPHGIRRSDDIRALWERCIGAMPDLPAKKHGRKRTRHPAGVDWSARKLEQIEAADIRTLHAEIGAHHATLANRTVEVLRAVFNHARQHGYDGANPAEDIKPFREKKRDRFIQRDELPRFFLALSQDTSADFRHFVLLSLLTGARRENVLSARWQDIDLERAVWRIPETKNDEPVTLPLVDEAIQVLRARSPRRNGYVFPAKSATGYMSPPKKRWAALFDRDELAQLTERIEAASGKLDIDDSASLERKLEHARTIAADLDIDTDGARIGDLRIHDLRRSLGSWQAITGASLVIIGKSLGHKSPDATMIYSRLNIDPVRASVTTATSSMLEAAGLHAKADVLNLPKKGAAK